MQLAKRVGSTCNVCEIAEARGINASGEARVIFEACGINAFGEAREIFKACGINAGGAWDL